MTGILACHTHKHVGTHTHTRFITQRKEKRKSFSDECSKDSNPVKGDAQPKLVVHLYGEWGVVRG